MFTLQLCFQRGNRILSQAREVTHSFSLFSADIWNVHCAKLPFLFVLNYEQLHGINDIDISTIPSAKFFHYVFPTSLLCT